jgi:hypothetical protein
MTALPKDWTIGVCAPGLGAPLPADLITHRHTVRVVVIWDDGDHEEFEFDQAGEAKASHERLAKRWKNAHATFERDRQNLTLTKRYTGEIGRVETVQHVDGATS